MGKEREQRNLHWMPLRGQFEESVQLADLIGRRYMSVTRPHSVSILSHESLGTIAQQREHLGAAFDGRRKEQTIASEQESQNWSSVIMLLFKELWKT